MNGGPAVIFDMDGTLLRLEVDIEEVRLRLAALFAPYGVTRPFRPILRRIHDAALEASSAGGDRNVLCAEGLAVLSSFEVVAARVARARVGAVETVQELNARGVRLAVVTDNGRACVPAALQAAGFLPAHFASVVTRDDVATAKPDPEGIVQAAARLGPASHVWYIGDHPKDVGAAHAARVTIPHLRVAALRGGLASDAQLEQAGADALLADPSGVLGLLGIAN